MTLNEILQEMKATSRSRIPAESAAIMARATEQLEHSGIVKNALAKGDKAPFFELQDWQGTRYNSSLLLSQGPLILHFYRGSW